MIRNKLNHGQTFFCNFLQDRNNRLSVCRFIIIYALNKEMSVSVGMICTFTFQNNHHNECNMTFSSNHAALVSDGCCNLYLKCVSTPATQSDLTESNKMLVVKAVSK